MEFLQAAKTNRAMWEAMAVRAHPVAEAARRLATAGGPWRLLVLADDWCGDAVNTLPVLARLADLAGIPLRIVPRDSDPSLRDWHLTNGSRSIPVVILLDAEGRCRGWWGPRPRPLQEWFVRTGRAMDTAARYRELRRWYARDRGITTVAEILEMVGAAARSEETASCSRRPAA